MNFSIEAMSKAIIVIPNVHVWSGTVTIRRDQDLDAANLPPRHLVSDGTKKVIDPKRLTSLETIRRGLNRELAEVGSRSPMGFLVLPKDEAWLKELLAKYRKQFEVESQSLFDNYEEWCEEWVEAQTPEYHEMLRRHRPHLARVQNTTAFSVAVFSAAELNSDFGKQAFQETAKLCGIALLDETAKVAGKMLESAFMGKTQAMQTSVNKIRELIGKLRGFTMFNPDIVGCVEHVEEVMVQVSSAGVVAGYELDLCIHVLKVLSDPDQMLSM